MIGRGARYRERCLDGVQPVHAAGRRFGPATLGELSSVAQMERTACKEVRADGKDYIRLLKIVLMYECSRAGAKWLSARLRAKRRVEMHSRRRI